MSKREARYVYQNRDGTFGYRVGEYTSPAYKDRTEAQHEMANHLYYARAVKRVRNRSEPSAWDRRMP